MSTRLDEIADWKPKASGGLKSDDNEYGFPTVVYRTPSRLMEECEKAFDAGLLLFKEFLFKIGAVKLINRIVYWSSLIFIINCSAGFEKT